jgi:hypothetical protein
LRRCASSKLYILKHIATQSEHRRAFALGQLKSDAQVVLLFKG